MQCQNCLLYHHFANALDIKKTAPHGELRFFVRSPYRAALKSLYYFYTAGRSDSFFRLCLICSPQQRHRHVIDVGPCRSRHDQSVHSLQRMISVVVFQDREDIEPCRGEFAERILIHISACCIGRSVCSVTAEGEYCGIRDACNACAGRERKLLVAAAETFPGQLYDGLAAGDVSELLSRCISRMCLQDAGKEASRFPRDRAELVCERMLARKLPASLAIEQSWSVSTIGL